MTMQYRTPARLGRPLSVIGQGCWQFGGDWGEVSEADATAVLDAAHDAGITFFDTADVYGDGRSERLVGAFRAESAADPDAASKPLFVATKASRRADPFAPETFTEQNIRAWIDRSRKNLGWTPWTWCSCTARPRRSTARTACSTCWTPWSRRASSPPGA